MNEEHILLITKPISETESEVHAEIVCTYEFLIVARRLLDQLIENVPNGPKDGIHLH